MLLIMMRADSGVRDSKRAEYSVLHGIDPDTFRKSETVSFLTRLPLPEALCQIKCYELAYKTKSMFYIEHTLLAVSVIEDLCEQSIKNAGNVTLVENLPQTPGKI